MTNAVLSTRLGILLLIPLALSVLLVPTLEANWLYLALGLVLAAWPLALAERALAVRVNQPLISGMQVLTRQSDAPRAWRILAWSSLAASVLLLTLVAVYAGALLTQVLQTQELLSDLSTSGLWSAATVVVVFLGVFRRFSSAALVWWLLPTLALSALLFWQMSQHATIALQTELTLAAVLPGQAMLLAGSLLLGAGVMVRWPVVAAGVVLHAKAAVVLLILAAVFFASLHHGSACLVAVLLSLVLLFLLLPTLAEPVIAAVQSRVSSPLLATIAVVIPVVLLSQWVTLQLGIEALQQGLQLLLIWMAVNAFILAIYAGWVMKTSHARKALQLPSEGVYNLWRVAIRWVAPITLLVALYQLASL